MRKFLLVIFLLPLAIKAQDYKRTFNWYFGDSAGINFATTPPVALNNGAMSTYEGCATISDTNGNLLFYTNSESVWNKYHQIMDNGDSILGGWSSTQSSIIIPLPDNDSMFYIFTTDSKAGWKGLRYHIVNINAQGNSGEVLVKNVILPPAKVCEKLVATKHANGRDVWVLVHEFTSNLFYAYLVTDKGLITCPVISSVGEVVGKVGQFGIQIADAQGAMKFSTDGTTLANCLYHYSETKIELFNFDKSTGKLSNPLTLSANTQEWNANASYGVEFSPEKRYLYYSNHFNYLFRVNLSKGTADSIMLSRDTLYIPVAGQPTLMERRHGTLQLTSGNKILVAFDDTTILSSIEYPDSSVCEFRINGLNLVNKKSLAGLPNFISSYFHRPVLDFDYKRDCLSDTMRFFTKDSLNRNNSNWTFKKVIGGSTVSSSIQHPIVAFSDTGFYEVQLSIGNDTVVKTIYVSPKISKPNLGQDTILCQADSFLLNIGNGYNCYMWQDWITNTPSFVARETGTYIVTVTDLYKCQAQDSIHIAFAPLPQVPIVTKINDSLHSTPSFSYLWFLNDTVIAGLNTQSIKPFKAGMYKVLITDSNGCSNVSTSYSSNVGTSELSNEDIKIYPNPATSTLIIELNNNVCDLSITDVTGRVVYTQYSITNSSLRLNCKYFHEGIYFIQIKDLNNTYRKKLIIQ